MSVQDSSVPLRLRDITQLGTSHTWVKRLPPFYSLKEGDWHAE